MKHDLQRAVYQEKRPLADGIRMTSCDQGGSASRASAAEAPAFPDHVTCHHARYGERPMDWRTRAVGLGGTTAVMAFLLAGALLTLRTVSPSAAPPVLAVFDVAPPAAPLEPEVAVPEGPAQVEQAEQKPRESDKRSVPPDILVPQNSPAAIAAPPPVEPATQAERVPETTAPRTTRAPPANRAAKNAEVTWEALLMAHLEKHRRYPAAARARREQGTVHVRFRMNRVGQVLWSRIERSSGSPTLDRAALDTFRRAQPLPAIPDDKAGELEFAMPVEFFVRR